VSLVGFKAQNHRQQVGRRGPNPLVDDRQTAPEVFAPLHERFGFTIDVAASEANAKLPRFYTAEQDGLAQSWAGERVWCNPPYSSIQPWVVKAHEEANRPSNPAELIVMLLPANRTEQGWWQDHVEPARRSGALDVEFLRGRMRFIAPDALEIKPNERPPFGVCLVIWDNAGYGELAA
jgi:phage N-6-adenine-methyltransferase